MKCIIATTVLCHVFIEEVELFDGDHVKVAAFYKISNPEQLEKLQPSDEPVENIVVNQLSTELASIGCSALPHLLYAFIMSVLICWMIMQSL